MKEDTRWKILAGLALVTLSLTLYIAHFLIFHDAHHLLIFLVGDIAFIPFEVFIVTIIIDQMLENREKKQRMEKLNMVIGTFFSNAGIPLLALLAKADPDIHKVRPELAKGICDTDEGFTAVTNCLESHQCRVSADNIDLFALREFLKKEEDFLLRIVENPMVFEHESFTNLILAITHLDEELKSRGNLASLPDSDIAHLEGDIHRVYSQLVPAWLKYMDYLKTHYPYLYSLAMRRNPFDPEASVIVGN
ncbi:MAG TPA: hypothetical protein HA272_04830 [Methanoregula sp.]|nr:hypothetical protein [Methanoregula sp.]